jgi:hypothetical protein
MQYPTIAEWNAVSERAAQLGVRLVLVNGATVQFVRIADGAPAGDAPSWTDAIGQLATWEAQ